VYDFFIVRLKKSVFFKKEMVGILWYSLIKIKENFKTSHPLNGASIFYVFFNFESCLEGVLAKYLLCFIFSLVGNDLSCFALLFLHSLCLCFWIVSAGCGVKGRRNATIQFWGFMDCPLRSKDIIAQSYNLIS